MTRVCAGVTPFASILKHVWYMQKRGKLGSLRRVEFFWICRDAPSFGWFQSLLKEVEAAQADRMYCICLGFVSIDSDPFLLANFLRINIYLTQKVGEDMLWNITLNDAGAVYDPLTLLRSHTMFGRPDWKAIYSRMRQAIESGQYVPGATSQLKTKVGVSNLTCVLRSSEMPHLCRHTFVVLVLLPKLLRKLATSALHPMSNSLSPRFVNDVLECQLCYS